MPSYAECLVWLLPRGLMGVDILQMTHALGIAGTPAAGVRVSLPQQSPEKRVVALGQTSVVIVPSFSSPGIVAFHKLSLHQHGRLR